MVQLRGGPGRRRAGSDRARARRHAGPGNRLAESTALRPRHPGQTPRGWPQSATEDEESRGKTPAQRGTPATAAPGVPEEPPRHPAEFPPLFPWQQTPPPEEDTRKEAIELWRDAWPIEGTPAALYLRRRGIDPLALMRIDLPGRWPETLRFSTAAPGIALVVAVHDARTGLVCGVQRIFINRDGAPIMKSEAQPWATGKDRKLKRSLGDIDGNAARFSEWPDPEGRLGLAEGPETALAAQQLNGFPVWAAIHGGNMAKIDPPEETREIVIFADYDTAGLSAAHDTRARHLANPRIERILIVCAQTLGADMADLIHPAGSE